MRVNLPREADALMEFHIFQLDGFGFAATSALEEDLVVET